MFRWLATNLRTFLLAFALALVVWVTAVTAANPDENSGLSKSYPDRDYRTGTRSDHYWQDRPSTGRTHFACSAFGVAEFADQWDFGSRSGGFDRTGVRDAYGECSNAD